MVEIIHFPKLCPHCKQMLFRVEKMSMAWSECRNVNCSFFTSQVTAHRIIAGVTIEEEPRPYVECFNRK